MTLDDRVAALEARVQALEAPLAESSSRADAATEWAELTAARTRRHLDDVRSDLEDERDERERADRRRP